MKKVTNLMERIIRLMNNDNFKSKSKRNAKDFTRERMVGIERSISITYLKIIGLTFIVALPSQLLIVGSISRRLLGKYFKPSTQKPVEFV